MEEMIDKIENAILQGYEAISKEGKILDGIEKIYRQVRFEKPELGIYIRKKMLQIAKERGDLP